MEWSVGDEAIFRRTRNCTLERNWNEQPLSISVFLTLLNVSPDFEQEVVFYFLSHSCMYSAVRPVFFRNFLFSSKLELLRTTNPPPSPSLSELSFGLIHNNFRTVTKWNLKWHFILVFLKAPSFFSDSQECFERKSSSVGVFHDSARGLTSPPVLHHGHKIWSERFIQ